MGWSLSTAAIVLIVLLNVTAKPDQAQSAMPSYVTLTDRVIALEAKLRELEVTRAGTCTSAAN